MCLRRKPLHVNFSGNVRFSIQICLQKQNNRFKSYEVQCISASSFSPTESFVSDKLIFFPIVHLHNALFIPSDLQLCRGKKSESYEHRAETSKGKMYSAFDWIHMPHAFMDITKNCLDCAAPWKNNGKSQMLKHVDVQRRMISFYRQRNHLSASVCVCVQYACEWMREYTASKRTSSVHCVRLVKRTIQDTHTHRLTSNPSLKDTHKHS